LYYQGKHVGIKKDDTDKRFFLKLLFANEGLGANDLGMYLAKCQSVPNIKYREIPGASVKYTLN
jgi:hypothetical protein